MSTSVQTIINGLNMELVRPVKHAHTETLNAKNDILRKTLAPLERHAEEEAKLGANESLSHQGKAESLKTFATKNTAPALKWLLNAITDKQAKDHRYRKQFFTVEPGVSDPTERTLLYTYLWPKLDVLDQKGRVTTFAQASEQDGQLVMAAMLNHPMGPMLDSEVTERLLIERAKRRTPRDYDNYTQNQIILEFLMMVREWVARWLFNEVHLDLLVLRTNFGDEIAAMFEHQTTGLPPERQQQDQFAGASR